LNQKTVLRGGYGLFWLPNNIAWNISPNNDIVARFNTDFVGSIDGGITPSDRLSNPFPSGIIQPPGHNPNFQNVLLGQGVQAPVTNNPYGYSQQWNLNVQREVAGGLLLDFAYGGAKGTHLPFGGQQIDQLPDQFLSQGSALTDSVSNPFFGLISSGPLSKATIQRGQLLRPFPQYNGVSLSGNGAGGSTYHSFQLKGEKRFQGGGSLLAAYTISKFISDTDTITGWLESGGVGGVQNWNNLRGERSLTSFDTPQRFVISYVMDLPVGYGKRYLGSVGGAPGKLVSGWGLEGVTTFQRGFPLHLGVTPNRSNSFGGGSRPNFDASACPNGAALTGSAESRLNRWFNTACFSAPPAFTFGNTSRNLPNVRAQGINNFDFSLFKNTNFGAESRFAVQFRAEVFNLFNHPLFGAPGQTLGTAQFGVVSSQVNTPRLIQFALRLNF